MHFGFALVLAGYMASLFAIFLGCRPFYKYWQIFPDPGNACEPALSRPIVWSIFAAQATSDVYLIAFPLPILWRSRLRLVEKIASTIVLCAGVFVLACATIKTAAILSVSFKFFKFQLAQPSPPVTLFTIPFVVTAITGLVLNIGCCE